MPCFTFYGGPKQATTKIFSLCLILNMAGSQEFTTLDKVAMKNANYFLRDIFAAVNDLGS